MKMSNDKLIDLNINASISETTLNILEDIKAVYKENYSDLSDADLWGYMIEDMLESYLEGSDEEDELEDSEKEDEELDDDEI